MKKHSQNEHPVIQGLFVMILVIIVGALGVFVYKKVQQHNDTQAETKSLSKAEEKRLFPARTSQTNGSLIVYQVNIPFYQNSPAGTQNAFADITKRLKAIADMGVTTIQLTPVHTSAYLVLDHYDVSWKYTGKTRDNQGTSEERIAYFRNYVNTAHKLGIKVIMDCIYHGTAKNSPLVTQHPDWYKRDAEGNLIINNFGLPQFDTSKKEVKDYVLDVSKFWVNKANIDGCRADIAHSIPLSFWANLNNEMRKFKSSWRMFGEAFGTQVAYVQPYAGKELAGVYGFDGVYDFYLQSVLRGIANQTRKASDIYNAWSARPKYHREDFYNMIDDQNAPIRSTTLKNGNGGMVAAMAVNFTLDGIPFMFNGQEIGDVQAGGPKIDETRYYSWENPPHPENRKRFKQLICLRRNNSSIRAGTTVWNTTSDPDNVVSYTRTRGKQRTLVVVNFSGKAWSGNVKGKLGSRIYGMNNRKPYKSSKSTIYLSLKPYSYLVASIDGSASRKTIAKACYR